MREIVLSDADIQSIINGRDVIKQSGETKIKIRQSYLKDAAMPVIKDRYNIADSVTEEHLKNFRASIQNTFRPGA
ncbi:hypothetical protein [Enterococcus sp. SMC-9]|uniref:hypothetical protein n=1 Tax=Enterococcus sp. SMC-9 TaxID=2862343 RepID=UPI001E646074|nr:hypothetical protein [Enterococcus sp. SMC-9]